MLLDRGMIHALAAARPHPGRRDISARYLGAPTACRPNLGPRADGRRTTVGRVDRMNTDYRQEDRSIVPTRVPATLPARSFETARRPSGGNRRPPGRPPRQRPMGRQGGDKCGLLQPSRLPALILLALLLPTLASALVPAPTNLPAAPASSRPPTSDIESDMLARVLAYGAEQRAMQRSLFLAAETALKAGQRQTYERLRSQLTDYPLFPYLRLADLRQRLDRSKRAELEAFLRDYAGQPVARELRRAILSRAASRRQWGRYLHFYRPTSSLRGQCQALQARLARGESTSLWPQVRRLWLTGESLPKACDEVIQRWRQAGQLDDALLWQRFALAMEKGKTRLGRYLSRQMVPHERRWARRWLGLHRYPEQLLRRHRELRGASPHARQILLASLLRLSDRDPHKAAHVWQRLAGEHPLPAAQQFRFYRRLAMSLALKHQPGAEAWFRRIPAAHQTDDSRAWRVRAAIRSGQWEIVTQAIAAMPATQSNKDRWRYWRARALAQRGQHRAANVLFRELAGHRNYFGFLAADRLSLPYAFKDRRLQTSAAQLFTLQEIPAIRRAAEFMQLGRHTAARREWRTAMAGLDEQQRRGAARLAQLWGWHGQSITTMASTSHRDDLVLRFPLQYKQAVLDLSSRSGLQAAWTYGVIRRESAFVSDARSPRGALGLMQLMPATAKRVSRQLRLRYRGSRQLLQPETNLALGTGYLAHMLERFDAQTVLATAAYNAGARRVSGWLPEGDDMAADRWIETIPYRETREYVSNVLAYTVIYARRLGDPDQRLTAHMSPVPGEGQGR